MVRSRNQLTFDDGWKMARIGKDEHPRILRMVDAEQRKVAEVAAEYGCTPANIYALLSKLRREASRNTEAIGTVKDAAERLSPPVAEERLSRDATAPATTAAVPDLFTPSAEAEKAPACKAADGRLHAPLTADVASFTESRAPRREPAPQSAVAPQQESWAASSPSPRSVVTHLAAPALAKKATVMGATLSKPGMALMMRTADGEENLTPFRSLDDLLSAVKPILRAAARSPDAVWFSIQPVDLASLDCDAA